MGIVWPRPNHEEVVYSCVYNTPGLYYPSVLKGKAYCKQTFQSEELVIHLNYRNPISTCTRKKILWIESLCDWLWVFTSFVRL